MTFSTTRTETFTIVSAREVAARVAADLSLMGRLYGSPSADLIAKYVTELTILLAYKAVQSIEYGFKRGDQRVVSLLYTARFDGTITSSDRTGQVPVGVNVTGATWFSFLTESGALANLPPADREQVESALPFRRSIMSAPQDGDGVWSGHDKTYGINGGGVDRGVFRPW